MRKIRFRDCWSLRHCGPELLNLEGWINVEFLELTRCCSLTNELESCPIMKNLKHLDVSDCVGLKALPNLTKSKNLMTLDVRNSFKLVKTYAFASKFTDSMAMDLHVGLKTLGVSLCVQFVASRIIGKFGVSSQVCSLQFKD